MSSPVIVNFTSEEKTKFLNFINEKIAECARRIECLERERVMLGACTADPPSKIPTAYIDMLKEKVKDWSKRVDTTKLAQTRLSQFTNAIGAGETVYINPSNLDILSALTELYQRERAGEKLEPKYTYYPRLKKAKEDALYVFSTKVKTITESTYVKVA